MDFRGRFDHGVVRPTVPVTLPDGTEVECRTVGPSNGAEKTGGAMNGFWHSRSIDELAEEQRTPRLITLSELRGDWPSDEPIDEFLGSLERDRR